MDNTYNIDFIARCIAGHNKTAIKSITTELENVQKQVGGVSLVEITQEDFDALTDKDPSTIYLVSNDDKITLYIGGAEVNEIEGIKVNGSTVNPDSKKVVSITVPTSAADVSALPDTTKYAAALSLTINSSTFVMTGQLKDQNGDNLGTAQTIDLPLESVVVGGSYNSQTKKVVLTLQNGNTIEFSVADLVSGLQTELSTSNKLNPAFIEYDSTHRAVSDTEKSAWNSKQNALTTAQLAAVNSGIDSIKVEQIETNKNNISTFVDPTAGDITFNSQLAQVPTVQAKYITQSGKTVNIQLYLDLGTAPTANTETVIGTLTGIDAPKNLYRGFCMVAAQYFSSDFETCFVGVGTTKSLYIKPKTGTTNTKYMINITYQTN